MTINKQITTVLTMEEVIGITSALHDRARVYQLLSSVNKVVGSNIRPTEDTMADQLAKQYNDLANRLLTELYDYRSNDPEDHCGS